MFLSGTGDDVVTDFGGNDRLVLDDSLWNGTRNAEQVVSRFATDTGADVVLDFGSRGQITLAGVGTLAGLAADILIV